MKKGLSGIDKKVWGLSLLLLGACGGGSRSSNKTGASSADVGGVDYAPLAKRQAKEYFSKLSREDLARCGKSQPINYNSIKVLSQKQAPWCAAFSNLQLLQEHQRKMGGSLEQLSPMHFAAYSTDSGSIRPFVAIKFHQALENIQKNGVLRSERDFPFDDEFFEVAIKKQLTEYFTDNKSVPTIETKKYSISIPSENLEKAKREAKGSLNKFFEELEIPTSAFVLRDKSVKPNYIPVREFNVYEELYSQNTLSTGLGSVFREFQKGNIVNTVVCGNKFDAKGKAIDTNAKDCGGHGVDLLNSRVENGRCEVLMLNSWGDGWGNKGLQWVDLEKLIEWMPVRKENRELILRAVHLETRAANAPVKNVLIDKTRNTVKTYTGETQDGVHSGHGVYTSYFADQPLLKEEVYDGEWKDRAFQKGKVWTFNQKGEIVRFFEGVMKDGWEDEGKLYTKDANGKEARWNLKNRIGTRADVK